MSELTREERYQESTFDGKSERAGALIFAKRENRNHAIKLNKIVSCLQLSGGMRVLEVGAGWGNHAYGILRKYPAVSYTGIDISQKTLDVAAQRLTEFNGRFVLKKDNANALSFQDRTFDAVFCAATLHHMAKPEVMVREMVRVAKEGGRVVLMEPNWIYPTNLLMSWLNKEDRNMWIMRAGNFSRWLTNAGLINISVDHLLYTPPKPKAFLPLYGIIDRVCGRLPLIRTCSLMLCGCGQRPGGTNK